MYNSGIRSAYPFLTRNVPILPKIKVNLIPPTLACMHRIFVLLLLCCQVSEANSQKIPDSTLKPLLGYWTNGFQFYSGEKVNDQLVSFSGGTLHEGAFYFAVAANYDGSLYIAGGKWKEDSAGHYQEDSSINKPSFGHRNDRLVLKKIGGKRVLIALTPSGACSGSLLEESQPFELDRFVRSNRIKYQLSGKYTDSVSGTAVTFWPDQPRAGKA